jgi:uncharacterized membrane protein YoaK (UPF0700 family)
VIAGGNAKYYASPRYGLILLLESTLLLVCFFMLPAPRRVEDAQESQMWMTAYLISFTAGLQNAMTTYFSGAIVRTTHVTGTLTDIGVELGAIVVGREGQMWKLCLLIIFYLGFFIGGVLGTLVAFEQPEWSLLPPACLTFCLAMGYLYFLYRLPAHNVTDTDVPAEADTRWVFMPELLCFFFCLLMVAIGLGIEKVVMLKKQNANFTWDDPHTPF